MNADDPKRSFLLKQIEREQVLAHQGQPWFEEWIAGGPPMDKDSREWIRTRPPIVQASLRDFPPGCVVKTKPTASKRIPAPGTMGILVSYFENGLVGVMQSPASCIRAQVHVSELEYVTGRKHWTREDINAVLGN